MSECERVEWFRPTGRRVCIRIQEKISACPLPTHLFNLPETSSAFYTACCKVSYDTVPASGYMISPNGLHGLFDPPKPSFYIFSGTKMFFLKKYVFEQKTFALV